MIDYVELFKQRREARRSGVSVDTPKDHCVACDKDLPPYVDRYCSGQCKINKEGFKGIEKSVENSVENSG